MPLGEIVARRQLEFVSADGMRTPVEVTIGRPVQELEGPWFCPYRISAADFERHFRSAGEDSMQALVLAQKLIVIDLEALATKLNGSFTWFGDANLGFS